jgi:hypothetical protein
VDDFHRDIEDLHSLARTVNGCNCSLPICSLPIPCRLTNLPLIEQIEILPALFGKVILPGVVRDEAAVRLKT